MMGVEVFFLDLGWVYRGTGPKRGPNPGPSALADLRGPRKGIATAPRHPSDRPGGEGVMAIQCGKRGCKQWGSGDRSRGGAVISRFGLALTMPH
jgi:hypothetical protein